MAINMTRGFITLALIALSSQLASAQTNLGRLYRTIPQPPKSKPADPLAVNPADSLPLDPGSLIWQVSDKDASAVPVWQFTNGRITPLGQIPVGTEVQLENFRRFDRTLYYALPWADGAYAPGETTANRVWVSGRHVKAVRLAAGQ